MRAPVCIQLSHSLPFLPLPLRLRAPQEALAASAMTRATRLLADKAIPLPTFADSESRSRLLTTAPALSTITVTLDDATVRAAFSHVPLWHATMDDVGMITRHAVAAAATAAGAAAAPEAQTPAAGVCCAASLTCQPVCVGGRPGCGGGAVTCLRACRVLAWLNGGEGGGSGAVACSTLRSTFPLGDPAQRGCVF